ncbi:MAG: hypothetical protein KatS3mg031_0860 [Chitinophagales bacterium]|nr:MAG: hypothetical protein KatS3mg031_0860 [Chitinophagales bacterium]
MCTQDEGTPFVMVGLERSGNTVTHAALKAHPEVATFDDEVKYSPFYTTGISVFSFSNERDTVKQASRPALLKFLSFLNHGKSGKAYGIYTVPAAKDAAGLVKAIQTHYPDVKIILVKRLNIVAQYASSLIANQSNLWIATKPLITPYPEVHFNYKNLVTYVILTLHALNELEKLKSSHTVLEWIYEEHLLSDSPSFNPLFDFLGVSRLDVAPFLPAKLNPPPETYIRNYYFWIQEVCKIIERAAIQTELKQQLYAYHTSLLTNKSIHESWLFYLSILPSRLLAFLLFKKALPAVHNP